VRTQNGDNNAYCQDNETSWFDWNLVATHADVHRLVRLLNTRRLLRELEAEQEHLTLKQLLQTGKRAWHGVKVGQPDWSVSSHSLAVTAEIRRESLLLYAILSAYWEPLEFELPAADDGSAGSWSRWIDTSLESPEDIIECPAAHWHTLRAFCPPVPGSVYRAGPRSVVILFAERL
jgi:isoamylase